MSVSVVIPTAGALDEVGRLMLADALKAAEAADEIVVVVSNDNLTPRARRVLEQSRARVVDVYPKAPQVFNYSLAVNAGVQETSGDDVLLLNDDIALAERTPEDWIERLASRNADIVGCMLVDPTEQIVMHAGVVFNADGWAGHAWMGQTTSGKLWRNDKPLAVTGACQLIRRPMWDKLGGYDLGFPVNYGDVSFCLSCCEAKGKIMCVNLVRLVHHHSATRKMEMGVTHGDHFRLISKHKVILRRNGFLRAA
jgi:GT2 family glycosyltransferase